MPRKLIGIVGWLTTFGLLAAAAPGCGSNDTEPEGTPVEVEKYPDQAAFCNGIAQAECSQAVLDSCVVSGKPACVAAVQQSCMAQASDVTRGVIASNYPTGKKAAEACIQKVTEAYADAKIEGTEHAAIKAACGEVFRGSKTAGFECKSDIDCSVGLGCYLTAADQGTCETLKTIALGDDCGAKGSVCDKGLYCGSDQACIKRKAVGSECQAFTKPCLENLLCANVDAMSGLGKCEAKKAQGTECTSDDECDSNFCALIGQKNLCVNALTLGAGAPACQNFGGS